MSKYISILSTKRLRTDIIRKALLDGLTIIDHDFISINFTGCIEDTLEETLIFTSARAVMAFDRNRRPGRWHKAYCLEGETLKALDALEHIEVLAVAPDALSLAEKIVADRPAGKLSFLCSCQRRNELPDHLHRHGISLQEIKVYETIYTGYPVKHAYSGALFFSPSAVESFFQTNILAEHIVCFCVGRTTEAAVKEHTDNRVISAAEPTQESVLLAVAGFFRNNKTDHYDDCERRNGENNTYGIKK